MTQAAAYLETAKHGSKGRSTEGRALARFSRLATAGCAAWLCTLLTTAHAGAGEASAVRHIDIVHMTHTDIGFTDHPLVCRRQQMRYCATCDYDNCPIYLGKALRSSRPQGLDRESIVNSGK